MRWARATYGGALGTEYLFPVQDVGRHGYKSDIKVSVTRIAALVLEG